MNVFSKVAELSSYTKAAKQLNIPKATVSRRIKSLEEKLQVKLINRDTRKLSLTEAGDHLYRSSLSSLLQLKAIERETSSYQTNPIGDLKVTMPVEVSIGLLNDIISDFILLYPQINLELNITNDLVDIITDGYDIAIRGGTPKDSNLIFKKILSSKLNFCCSQQFLDNRAHLRHPADIANDELVTFNSPRYQHLKLTNDEEEVMLHAKNNLNTNSFDMLLQYTKKGLGIAVLPTSVCYDAITSGELVSVLQDWHAQDVSLYALYPDKVKTKKLELFISYIKSRLESVESKFKLLS